MTQKELYTAYVRFENAGNYRYRIDQEKVNILLDGIYSAVVVRDIWNAAKENKRAESDYRRCIARKSYVLADNIGNNTSANSIEIRS